MREMLSFTAAPPANRDLYKWAMKLLPFAASGLVANCFALAREIRVLDMRASPYDFSTMDLAPMCFETPESRADCEAARRDFAWRAASVRGRLIALCDQILSAVTA
jgi:hypothetical protein